MPNWCYTQVCFRGKPENIERLIKDVEAATKFHSNNRLFCNIRYFMHLNGFDTVSYYERFKNKYIPNYYDCNFRGSIIDGEEYEEEDGLVSYYPTFEMAWYTDYQLLQLISMIYDVKFSAYSEEPGCEIYDKCRNDSSIDEYDFDYIISPDYEQFEEALECDYNHEIEDLGYDNPVKDGDPEAEDMIRTLEKHGIEYNIKPIQSYPVPTPFGVYYHYTYGVIYDTNENYQFFRYPELDPFNRYLVKGVTYDTNE